jgi:hypothetical protein
MPTAHVAMFVVIGQPLLVFAQFTPTPGATEHTVLTGGVYAVRNEPGSVRKVLMKASDGFRRIDCLAADPALQVSDFHLEDYSNAFTNCKLTPFWDLPVALVAWR